MPTLMGVQYLRAVAALSVLWFHAAIGAGGHDAVGTGGVDIFFVISGFLMFHLAGQEPAPAAFAWARVRRIVPAYWIVTLLVAGVQLIGATEHSTFDLQRLIKSLLFIPDLDPMRGQIYPTLIVGWTLNYEMLFYAIVTGLLLLRRSARLPALLAVFAALLSLRSLPGPLPVPVQFYSDPIILEFALGAGLAECWRRGWMPHGGTVIAGIGVLLMISPQPAELHRVVGYGIPAAMIVLGILAVEYRRTLPQSATLKLLGDASYSIYLWHIFVTTLVFRLLASSPPAFAIAVLGGIGLGLASYFAIERPIARLTSRFRRDPRAAASHI